ncbi:MAG: TIGR00730 family Rossman fold protein, partial [Bacteroidetes bacterium]|nr:TIGR00730 family Rossman fold protein [Bacteroidota bacterium]MBT4340133.1 TIGR00730 family Rossman fold protein [Bacteroidota bacterium]MBT4730094.1 TIGR00730 family Rossman fold protein [Bacteroidota bacterium]MBT6837539.1 TIGR00730 family Rossman fold protein [Bacteroidota bacterium]MBT7996519.1 TIGR00730 family Rossman fold protein [Bacteroidota bacterium]
WTGLIDWIKTTMIKEETISPEDLDIFKVVDTVDEAVKVIDDFYTKFQLRPNF